MAWAFLRDSSSVQKAGIDPVLQVEIIRNSFGFSRALANWAPGILEGNLAPGFAIDLLHKDIALAVQMARANGVRAMAAALAEQVVQEARSAGYGSCGTPGLIRSRHWREWHGASNKFCAWLVPNPKIGRRERDP